MEKITLNYSASGQKLKPLYSLKKFASDTVNYVVAVFDLDESWAFDSVRAVWKTENACISTVLDQDGACTVPQEVLQKKAKVEVNLVGSDVEENQLTERLTTYPVQAFIVDRDVPICGSETAEITPSQFEQFVQIVTAEVAKIRDVDRVELNDDYTITFYYSDGTESPKIGPIRGETGADGNGIQNITKIGSEGRIDTYRIIYTNGEHFDFNVTNGEKGDKGEPGETGNGIDRIEKTGTVGSVDTYTIYFTDGTTTTFDVTDGEVTNAVLDEATIVQTNTDNVPYLFRPSGGDVRTGRKEFDTIVGGTIAWNQLIEHGNFDEATGWSSAGYGAITVANNIGTFTISESSNSARIERVFTPIVGHKYLAYMDFKPSFDANTYMTFQSGLYSQIGKTSVLAGNWVRCIGIRNVVADDTTSGRIRYYFGTSVSVGDTVQFRNAGLIDLTAMFGSTIADYIYSLEQATAGAGVAWFKKLFPKDYYPYDPGTLRSVEGVSAHETVGFNQWDEEWRNGYYRNTGEFAAYQTCIANKNHIRVTPGATYYFMSNTARYSAGMRIVFRDSDGATLSSTTINGNVQFDVPENCYYIDFSTFAVTGVTTYNHDICINLSDPSKNGTYEPYVKHSYPLDSSLTLRGIPKLDASNNLYYDGDVYESDGSVTRKYGVVDLGTVSWNAPNESGRSSSTYDIGAKPAVNGGYVNLVSTYQAITPQEWYNARKNGVTIFGAGYGGNGRVGVVSSSFIGKTAAEIKTAMSGVYLVYELATPTTETAEPFTNPQVVDPSGTEEYVGSPIPVGHETDYPMTLTDTMPTANGTYTLNLTVANGKRSVSWTNELAVAIAAL